MGARGPPLPTAPRHHPHSAVATLAAEQQACLLLGNMRKPHFGRRRLWRPRWGFRPIEVLATIRYPQHCLPNAGHRCARRRRRAASGSRSAEPIAIDAVPAKSRCSAEVWHPALCGLRRRSTGRSQAANIGRQIALAAALRLHLRRHRAVLPHASLQSGRYNRALHGSSCS